MPVGSNWAGDDHPTAASLRYEGVGYHYQVTPEEAAANGWYYRREWYLPLEPDTRRCRDCGDILFDAILLTPEQAALRSPMSTNVLLGEG